MPKLHEVLAVSGNLKGQADKTRGDLEKAFSSKDHLFKRTLATFKPSEEGKPESIEEQTTLQTTVPKELSWITPILAKSMDADASVAVANTLAKASVILDDDTIITGPLPATALLELEKRCGEIHGLVSHIPTLDPAKGFSLDAKEGEGIYRADLQPRVRTKKIQKVVSMAKATKEHKEQVQLVSEDKTTGHLETTEWSGMLTPASKADMLSRVDEMRRAIKRARSRANDHEVPKSNGGIAIPILDYVFRARSGSGSSSS